LALSPLDCKLLPLNAALPPMIDPLNSSAPPLPAAVLVIFNPVGKTDVPHVPAGLVYVIGNVPT